MSVRSVLARGRRAALARAESRVTVRRKTGATVWDEEAGRELPAWEVPHTGVPFRLDGSSGSDGGSRTVNVAGVEYQQATGVGHFPADLADLADGDYVEVTAGEWAGAVFQVVEALRADQKTERRVPIEAVDRPGEWP